jgi:hypothetical protein
MSKKRELLERCLDEFQYHEVPVDDLIREIKEFLAQSEQEQEPVTDKPTETAMAVMPNGVCVSNVYDAYEEGRKSVMSEQEPVAWMVVTLFNNELIKEFHTVKPMERVYKYCKVTELFATPQKREPLSEKEIREGNPSMLNATREIFIAGVRFAEVMHGIGVGDE